MLEAAFFAVALIGLLHGLEPGHGWPVAALYSIRSRRPIPRALLSSSVISFFHLISSVTVVAVYVLLKMYLSFTLPYVNYIAGFALAILGARFLLERSGPADADHGHLHEDFGPGEHIHEHEHPSIGKHMHPHKHTRRLAMSLWGLAVFAFVLGFAHEEEFALLALAIGGVDPLALMLIYASGVTAALVGITLVSVKVFKQFEDKSGRYQRLIPKASGLILIIMAFSFIAGLR